MKYLDYAFLDPESNLACDEALLDACERGSLGDILRFWESRKYFVVIGYSNKISSEANLLSCRSLGVPVLRRISGGGAVVQGPGCLNYSLIVKSERAYGIGNVADAYEFVLKRHQDVFQRIMGGKVEMQGISDLVVDGRKFSGNAQHRKRRSVLFHGTFLLDFDMVLIETCLRMPSRQPGYRQNRSHENFLRNLKVEAGKVREELKHAWNAVEECRSVPHRKIDALVKARYSRTDWNFKF